MKQRNVRPGLWIWMVLLLGTSPAAADAFTFHFDFEDPGAPLVFNGSARRTTDSGLVISGHASGQLTDLSVSHELGKGAAGSIILADPVPTSFLDVVFSFHLFGGESANPFGFFADGISWAIFGGSSPEVVGRCCSELGFGSIVAPGVPAFAVEFDTYDNENVNCENCPADSPAPHIAVDLGNSAAFSETRNQSRVSAPFLRNQEHTAHIVLSNYLLSVFLDGHPMITGFLVPPQFVPEMAFVGFTGSTGSYSDYQIIDEITVTNVPEPASLSLLLLGLGAMGGIFFSKRINRCCIRG